MRPTASTCTPKRASGGETEQRLYTVAVWHETPFFTYRERAALEWTETVTRRRYARPDDVYERVRKQSAKRIVNLTLAIIAINGWNAWRFRPNGARTYKPKRRPAV